MLLYDIWEELGVVHLKDTLAISTVQNKRKVWRRK